MRPARPLKAGYIHLCSALFLIINDFCQTNYLKICRTDFRQIFTAGRRTMAVDDPSEIGVSIPRGTLPWQPVLLLSIAGG